MGIVVHVRTESGVERLEAADLAGPSSALTASTLTAVRAEGPFAPLAPSLTADGMLRDALARALPIPSLRGYGRLRIVLAALVLLPIGALLELDRELVSARHASIARGAVDLILAAFVAFELSRPTPRARSVAALALVTIGLRWTLVATRLCGRGVSPLVYGAAALAAASVLVWLLYVPSRSRVVLELAARLGISRSDLLRATAPDEPSPALVAAAVACAAGLPTLLHLARLSGSGLFAPALASLGFALIAPLLVRRFLEMTPPPARSPSHVVAGVVAGAAVTAAIVTTGRLFFDVGTELAQCARRLDVETRLARAAESAELAGAITKVRASLPLVLVTTLVQPFAEERIFRGLLLEVLARRYGRAYGLVAASLGFGVAHLGIYHVALYQTVLLGAGFGVAYLEGGLLAAFLVHAAWNALQLAG